MKQPYKYWKRSELLSFLVKQAVDYNIETAIIQEAVYSMKWQPQEQYNGCNFVQDDYHPFLPCFIHDYRWIVYGRKNKYDIEFKNNLMKFGYSKYKANLYYIAVRMGSIYFNLKEKYGTRNK